MVPFFVQDELLAELEEMEQEDIETQLLDIPDEVSLPTVPTSDPSKFS